ncbi:hypothetical protein A1704_22480 [Chryseobacterium cucumeris]|uniref:hypothetical protein n=1 Tax=Chryseobacterium cucumeris TaxID=1813611 RepID=UPI000786C9E4|nr:hypothetical protein [Chryseobacterium cucumeris]KYH06739.1 hypothetical protein A1704_22480 [Chryseobacterium cucumeris]
MMKKTKLLMLMALAFFLFGCRTELSDNFDSHISQSDYRKTVKLKEALAFKNYLTEAKSNPSQVYNKNADFFSALSDESTVTIIVQNNVTSYSTVIRHLDRSSDVLVYSIDNENKSIGFTAKYTPEDRTKNYHIDNFTGTVEFTAMDGKPMGVKELSNGTPLPDKVTASKNSMNKAGDCSFSIRLIEVECNGEHHSPSQIAQCTASQKPYYIVEITEVCSGGGQPPKGFPNMGTYDGGGSSTGGGTTNEMTIQDSFNYMLGEAGFPELSPDEYAYIQNNQYFGGQLLSYFYNNINQNNSQFLHWSINYFKNYADPNISPNAAYKQFQNWFLNSDGTPKIHFDNSLNSNNTEHYNSWQEFFNTQNNGFTMGNSLFELGINDNNAETGDPYPITNSRVKLRFMKFNDSGVSIKVRSYNLGTSSFNIHDIVMNQYGITSLWSFVYEDPNNKWDGPFPYVSNGNVYAKININIIVKKGVSIQGLNVTIDTPIKITIIINPNNGNIIGSTFSF